MSQHASVSASGITGTGPGYLAFPTAGHPVPQTLEQRHLLKLLEGRPQLTSPSLHVPSAEKTAELIQERSHSGDRISRKERKSKREMHQEKSRGDLTLQSSLDFAQYIDCFLSLVRSEGLKEVPLKSDGVKVSVLSPNWGTLVYLAARAKAIHEIPVSTLLELFNLIVLHLEESNAIETHCNDEVSRKESSVGLLKAFNAAMVSLIIMSSDNINRCLILDEILEKTVLMLKVHTSRTIVPLLDESARAKVTHADSSYWKLYDGAFSSLVRVMHDLLRRLNFFYLKEKVPECHAISVIDVCCTLLRLPKDSELKSGAMWLLVSCFMQHETLREIITEEISAMVCSEGTKLCTLFRISSKTSIHFPVAVILSLIQSVSKLPIHDQQLKMKNEDFQNHFTLSFEQIELNCRAFVACIMSKALKPGRSLSDSRAFLQLLLDDIFACLFLPAWPAAEMILVTIFNFLRNVFAKENVNNSRTIAVELLGSILTKLQSHIVAVQRDVSIIRPRTDNFDPSSSIHTNPENEKVGCDCDIGVSKNCLMLDCDECHYWFHGKCVEICEDNIPDSWICSSCELRHSIEQQRSVMNHVSGRLQRKALSSEISEDDILFQILLNFFNANSVDHCMQFSKDFVLTLWCKRVQASDPAKSSLFYSFFANDKFTAANQDLEGTSRIKSSQAHRIIRVLSQKYSLLQDSDMMLKVFVNMLNDKQPFLRSRIIKALSVLVETNVEILGHDYVIRAISVAVQDKATSVREAAIELLGKKMLANSSLSEKYYPIIASRIRDKGLSVRKRCVKILRDLCIEFPNHSKYIDICTKLVSRTQDESSVRQLVQKALQDLWFSQFLQPSSRKSSSSGTFCTGFLSTANRIVEVVASLPTLDWLSEIIIHAADSGCDSHDGNMFEVYSDFCSCIVQKMIAFSSPAETLHHVRTLYVFCCARPLLLLEHLSCLQPLLKVERSAQGIEQSRLSLLCSIFLMTLPFLENPRQRFLENLSSDLKELILQQSASVLLNAVPCLCVLSSKMDSFALPQQLLRSFYHYLCQYKNGPKSDGRVVRSVIRSLISVAEFKCLHYWTEILKVTYENIILLFRSYFQFDDKVIRRTALQGLFYCYYRKPSFLVPTCDIIESALSTQSDLELHAQVFHSFSDFLQNESDQLQYLQGLQSDSENHRFHGSRCTSIRREEDSDTECGVIVSIVQKIFPLCIQHVSSTSSEVWPFDGTVLVAKFGQRLVNPIHCAPSLIALCTDESERIANLAFTQISDMSVSFPDMLRNSIINGIKKIAIYQKQINGSATKMFESDYPVGLVHVFQIISKISHNIPSLLVGILNIIDFERNRSIITVEFVTMLLSGLPLQNDEPLHLYYHVSRVIGIHGASVDEQLRSVLKEPPECFPAARIEQCLSLADKIETLIHFKRYLQNTFNVADHSLETWNPHLKSSIVCSKKEFSSRFIPNLKDKVTPRTIEQLAERYKTFKRLFHNDLSEVSLDYTVKATNKRKVFSPKTTTPKRRRKSAIKPVMSEEEPDTDLDDAVIFRPKRRCSGSKLYAEPVDSSSIEADSSV